MSSYNYDRTAATPPTMIIVRELGVAAVLS